MRPVPILAFVLAAGLLVGGCASGPQAGGKEAGDTIEATTRAQASDAEASHDYAAAASAYASLAQKHPDDAALTLAVARNLRYSGQVQPAIDQVSAFMGRHGKSATLMCELGKAYLAADRLGLAVATLRQARDLDPGDWQTHSALGVALDYQGHYDEAQAAYRQALTLSPDNPVVLNNLGLSQAQAGRLDAARATLEKAVDQPQASAQVRQNLALIKALGGDFAGAERINRQDLPPEAVRANGDLYRKLKRGAIE